MALNNNSKFYNKFLDGILFFFCLGFVFILNLMRFNDLAHQNVPLEKSVPTKIKTPYFLVYEGTNKSVKIYVVQPQNALVLYQKILNRQFKWVILHTPSLNPIASCVFLSPGDCLCAT